MMNNLKSLLALLIVFLYLLIFTPAFAQLSSQNLSNVDIDSYSDAQIRDLLKQAQASGISDAQLIQQAQSKQMPAAQTQKLQLRIANLRKKESTSVNYNDTTRQTGRQLSNQLNNQANNQDISQKDEEADVFASFRPKIFGASLFRNSVNNSFEPNLKLATPINYILGPDDHLIIEMNGNSVNRWDLTVSPEGNINIPNVGRINVAQRTIEQATQSIKVALSRYFAIGQGTNVSVNLGDIRSIKVIMQGELVKPGTYTLPSLSTVFNALYLARGPNDIGSFRTIQVVRAGRLIRTLDLYDFLLKGSRKDDVSLRDQDVIIVPPYDKRVELKGEVKIPALFETVPGETLQDIINFAGGFTDMAYTARISAIRVSDRQRRMVDIIEKDFKTAIPARGDIYTVNKILDRFENRVTIQGAVFRPGDFELQNGLTVSQLIKNAGGLREDAFTGRGSLIRLNQDNSKRQSSFNIADILTNKTPDILLQREDSIYVSSVFDLRDKYIVTIKGQVREPGEFAYADSMQVSDLIIMAGGLKEGASNKRLVVSRRITNADPTLRNGNSATVYYVNIDATLTTGNLNFVLKPYDVVSVYATPGYEVQKYVKVEGEVMLPGDYPIENKNEKISDLIAKAGGLIASADIEGSSLKRDNAAILGVDKTKIDINDLNNQRKNQLNRLKSTYSDDDSKDKNTTTDSVINRNNYIGIDLKKILQKPGGKEDLILEDGDILRVPKQQQIVKVNGEVLYPSAVVFNSGQGLKEYVLSAGGYSPKALKRGTYVVYPNGSVKGTRKFLFFNFYPRVKAGSEVYVPEKPVSTSNTAQTILGYTTGLASLAVIIVTLFKK